jgi:hypothetical protein
MLRLSFTEHPASVGETYGEHFRSACNYSASMIWGGLACLVHAIFPFVFVSTGSSTVRKLHERMVTNRVRGPASGSPGPVALSSDISQGVGAARKPASTEKEPAHD